MKLLKHSYVLFLSLLLALSVFIPIGSYADAAEDLWNNEGNFAGWYGGGSGTTSDPWLITQESELALFCAHMNGHATIYRDRAFKLTKNLDMWAHYWDPVMDFAGTFDGDGHVIYNIRSERGTNCGFFNNTNGATIKNLGFAGTRIFTYNASDNQMVGGIIGKAQNTTLIRCFVTKSDISGSRINVGGLIGQADNCIISSCFVSNTAIRTAGKSNILTKSSYDSSYHYNPNACSIYVNSRKFLYHTYQDYYSYNITIYGGAETTMVYNTQYSMTVSGLVGGSSYKNTLTDCYFQGSGSGVLREKKSYRVIAYGPYSYTSPEVGSLSFSATAGTSFSFEANSTNYINALKMLWGQFQTYESPGCNLLSTISLSSSDFYGLISSYQNTITNCYFYCDDAYADKSEQKLSSSQLKAKTFNSDYATASHINNGYPYLKIFYWENQV